MKKLMTVFLAAALVFAVASKVSATPLETSGEYRARLWYLDNYAKDGQSTEFWDQRLRLVMVWPVAEGVKLTARADIMEGFWGDKLTNQVGDSFVSAANDRSNITFDWVNLQFVIPNTPATITVGRQNCNWGTGFWVAQDNRDRFKITGKIGESTTLLYTYDKFTEVGFLHDTNSLDDRRQHSFGVISKLSNWNVGLVYAIILDETTPDNDFMLNGFDGYAIGKIGGADLKAEVAWATGKNDFTSKPDQDVEGLMAYLGFAMPIGSMTLGLEGAFNQGDKADTSKNENGLKTDYQSPFWSVILFNNFDYNGFQGESNVSGDTSLNNAWAGKASLAWALNPKFSVYGAALYATRDQLTAAQKAANVDKAMGVELDLVMNYKVTANVSWTVGGGYLMAGDFYGDVSDPWGAVSAFTLSF